MALPHGYYNSPPAYMGFVGYFRLRNGNVVGNGVDSGSNYSHSNMIVRATSAEMNATQAVTKPDTVDSRYDKTIYQLGPKEIDGSLTFPAVYDRQSGASIVEALYRYAVTRNPQGLLSDFSVDVKYATSQSPPNQADFVYYSCVVNTWQFSVTQGDLVNQTVAIIGLTRDFTDLSTAIPAADLTNTRAVVWADARVELVGGRLSNPIGGQYVRSFEANINNNADRFYTLNKELFAQAIAPTKRDVDGNLVLMGRHMDLAELAWTNQNYCSETTNVKFGFITTGVSGDCASAFNITLPNCVFEIEEMSLSNELFETTVNWHCLPAAGTGLADPLLSSLNSTTFSY